MRRLPDGWRSVESTRFGLDLVTLRELWWALLERKLLVFRDQLIEPPHHVSVSGRFGSLFDDSTDAPRKNDPLDNYVRFVREPGAAGFDNVWHTDGSFRSSPPAARPHPIAGQRRCT